MSAADPSFRAPSGDALSDALRHGAPADSVRSVLGDPARLEALRRTALLDAAAEEAFDQLTALATRLLGVPVALVSLVDQRRQYFASARGLPEPWQSRRQTPLSHSFCQHVVTARLPLVIADARTHPAFAGSPAVADLGVVAYAGVPIVTRDGHALGTVCAIDTRPRDWTAEELEVVQLLADQATARIDLRLAVHDTAEQAERVASAEATAQRVIEGVPEALFTLDSEWRFVHVNARAAALLGRTRETLAGVPVWKAFPQVRETPFERELVRARAQGVPTDFEAHSPTLGIDVEVHADPSAGPPGGVAVYFRDITARRAAELALREREARLALFVAHAPVAVAMLDRQMCYVVASRRWAVDGWLGDVDLTGRSHYDVFPNLPESWKREYERALAGEVIERPDAVLERPDGTVEHLRYQIHPWYAPDGAVGGIIVVSELVTERVALERQLQRLALHDALTGLANRTLFHDRVTHALVRRLHAGCAEEVAVLFLDLDDFKTVNDSLGHAAGDRLLVEAAARLQRATRGFDTVARLGGDEFAVLLEGMATSADAELVAMRVLRAFVAPFVIDGAVVRSGASVGIAHATPHVDTDALLRNADLAMYRAKTGGKARVATYDPAMHAAVLARLSFEADLREAVAEPGARGLTLVYQPVMDLATGRASGVEALLRWRHPERGWVPPSTSIPIAEETGLILRLGRWALGEVCRQIAAWDEARPDAVPGVAVNFSSRQLEEPDVVRDVAAALHAAGIAPARLTLEITETALARDPEAARDTLTALKALGVQIAVDDFGTGYSSLSYLQQFPVDVLKIDKRFVDGVATGGLDAALARTIVALGDALALRCVAEGVERAEQRDALTALGCAYAQGYLFARPLSADDVVPWIERYAGTGA
jgi:diguanylate cyclase (GGDEF)-like protein/PAS domain S-box-containing protein